MLSIVDHSGINMSMGSFNHSERVIVRHTFIHQKQSIVCKIANMEPCVKPSLIHEQSHFTRQRTRVRSNRLSLSDCSTEYRKNAWRNVGHVPRWNKIVARFPVTTTIRLRLDGRYSIVRWQTAFQWQSNRVDWESKVLQASH